MEISGGRDVLGCVEDRVPAFLLGEVKMRLPSMTAGYGAADALGFPSIVCGCAVAALLVMLMVGGPPVAQAASNPGPSFDCTKAASADERTICANPYLSRIDVLVARAYADFVPEFAESKRAIGKWLLDDRYNCGTDEACIAAVEVNALQTYGGTASWPVSYVDALIGAKAAAFAESTRLNRDQPIPQQIGDCAMTHIAEITTRFGEPFNGADPGAGSAVRFTNDGGQVSYDAVSAFYDAKAGDPVVMCLVSVPRDCPRDDDRGRVYYGLDARTGGTWSLPDSQHSCGGA